MHHGGFKCYDDRKTTSLDDLMEELNSVKRDISTIKNMEVPEEAKTPILRELKRQVNEVKEKMHDYIDSL